MNVRLLCTTMLLALAIGVEAPSLAYAQPALNREIGPGASDRPLVITSVSSEDIGRLAKAVGVPMGLEIAPPARRISLNIVATKRPLRDVLDEIVAQDSRYQWREMDGVVVLRPVLAWYDVTNPLVSAVDPFALDDITSADALSAVRRLFGLTGGSSVGPGDTAIFSAALPQGGSLLEAFNAIVRAHGTLVWVFEPRTGSAEFPMAFSLNIGPSGVGFGVPAEARIRRGIVDPKPTTDADAGMPPLDRLVKLRPNGDPVILPNVWLGTIETLARATGIPMGFEGLPPSARLVVPKGFNGAVVSGLPARRALDVLCALDTRYEWREMGGVAVIRPKDAWNDPNNRLFRVLETETLDDVTLGKAVSVVVKALGGFQRAEDGFPETRRISVRPSGATILDVLNAIVEAHGAMTWHWEALSPQDAKEFGLGYEIGFALFGGGGHGFRVP